MGRLQVFEVAREVAWWRVMIGDGLDRALAHSRAAEKRWEQADCQQMAIEQPITPQL